MPRHRHNSPPLPLSNACRRVRRGLQGFSGPEWALRSNDSKDFVLRLLRHDPAQARGGEEGGSEGGSGVLRHDPAQARGGEEGGSEGGSGVLPATPWPCSASTRTRPSRGRGSSTRGRCPRPTRPSSSVRAVAGEGEGRTRHLLDSPFLAQPGCAASRTSPG